MTNKQYIPDMPGPELEVCPFCFNTDKVIVEDGVIDGCPMCEIVSAIRGE